MGEVSNPEIEYMEGFGGTDTESALLRQLNAVDGLKRKTDLEERFDKLGSYLAETFKHRKNIHFDFETLHDNVSACNLIRILENKYSHIERITSTDAAFIHLQIRLETDVTRYNGDTEKVFSLKNLIEIGTENPRNLDYLLKNSEG